MRNRLRTWLSWSERKTGADLRYILKHGSWVVIAQACNSVLSFVLLIGFANLLPKELYGTYRYALSLVGILTIFTLTGMNNAVARSVAKGEEGVFRPAIRYQLKWNQLMLLALVLLSLYYVWKGDPMLSLTILAFGALTPVTLALNTYGSLLEGRRRFPIANTLNVLSTLTYSLGMLGTLMFTDSIPLLALMYGLATFVPALAAYTYTMRREPPGTGGNSEDTLRYGRELTYLRLLDPLMAQIDKVVLGSFWGAAPLATYAFATAVPNRAMLFLKSWVGIGFPKFAGKDTMAINTVFYRRIFQGMFVGVCATIGYILLSPYVFRLLLPQYIDSILYSQFFSLIFVVALPNRYISLLMTSQGMSKVLMKRTIIVGVLNVLAYVIGGIWGGIPGLIGATLVMGVVTLIINIVMWRNASTVGR